MLKYIQGREYHLPALLLCLIMMSGAFAQTGSSIDYSGIRLPRLDAAGGSRGIIPKALVRLRVTDAPGTAQYWKPDSQAQTVGLSVKNDNDLSQLWWVVEDMDNANTSEGFLLVNAYNNYTLYKQSSDNAYYLRPYAASTVANGATLQRLVHLHFQKLNNPAVVPDAMVQCMLRESEALAPGTVPEHLVFTQASGGMMLSHANYTSINYSAGTGKGKILYEKLLSVASRNVPFFVAHSTAGASVQVRNNGVNSVTAIQAPYPGASSEAFTAVSGRGFSNDIAPEMFVTTFSPAATAEIGFSSYQFANYVPSTFRNASPACGLRCVEGSIRLFTPQDEVVTNFNAALPVVWGMRFPDTLTARQGNVTFTLKGFPAYYAISFVDQTFRLVASLNKDSLLVAYKPESGVYMTADSGSRSMTSYSTDPDLPFSKSLVNNALNRFDWRARTWNIRVRSNNAVQDLQVQSPFFYSWPAYAGIAANYDYAGRYVAGEDNEPAAGWELIKADLGYNADNTLKPANGVLSYPYLILYNRYTATLRSFVFISSGDIANNLKISLTASTNTGKYQSGGSILKPVLWSDNLTFSALDSATRIAGASYAKLQPLVSQTSGRFYYADYQMSYDPCVAFFESSIKLQVDKVTQGDMSITGRMQGGVLPAGTPAYHDWLTAGNAGNYLVGALETPFGAQVNTLGDISMKQYQSFGLQQFTSQVQGLLVGNRIPAYQKEAAELEFRGRSVVASGAFLNATGKAAEAAAEIGTAWDITSLSTKAVSGAAKMIQASGMFLSASGSAMLASASAITYNAIKDKVKNDDQQINLTLPDPRPSLIFGELMLKGSLSITTSLVEGEYITTPGSKYADYAPEYYLNGSKGAFPLYNEPLGTQSILRAPLFGIGITRNGDEYGFAVRTRYKPYLAVNAGINGYVGSSYTLRYVVSTYNANGQLVDTRKSLPYSFTGTNLPGIDVLPGNFDITGMVNADTIKANIATLFGAIPNTQHWNKWISVSYQLDAIDATKGLFKSGDQLLPWFTSFVKGGQSFGYEQYSGAEPLTIRAGSFAAAQFPEYNFQNDPVWGTNYIITNRRPDFQSLMNDYCNSRASTAPSSLQPMSSKNVIPADSTPVALTRKGDDAFTASPNPSTDGIFNLQYTAPITGEFHIQIRDMQGHVLLKSTEKAIHDGSLMRSVINISGAASGTYLAEISFKNGYRLTSKLVKL